MTIRTLHLPVPQGTAVAWKRNRKNKETLILDATCAPAHIRYLQDISLLNEGREFLEDIIQRLRKYYGLLLPRRYKRQAGKAISGVCEEQKAYGEESTGGNPQAVGICAP